MATRDGMLYFRPLIGAASAVDVSGRLVREAEIIPRPTDGVDPAAAIASDMAHVLYNFGRAARCARHAVDAGRRIDDLPAGCTLNGSNDRRTSVQTLRQSTLARFSR